MTTHERANMAKQDGQGARTPAQLEGKYNFGKSFAEAFGLAEDAQKAADAAAEAVEKLDENLTPEEIFNRLTDNGKVEAIYRGEDGKIYVNASYIQSGKIKTELLEVDSILSQSGSSCTTMYELETVLLPVLQEMPEGSTKFISEPLYIVENIGKTSYFGGEADIILRKGKMTAGGINASVFMVMNESGHVACADCYANSEDGDWTFSWSEIPTQSYGYGIYVDTVYRTTERWTGKPVYSKIISFGSLPNATVKYVSHGLPVTHDKVIGLRVVATNSTETIELPAGSGGSFAAYAFCKDDTVAIRSNVDLSGYTATVELKWIAE